MGALFSLPVNLSATHDNAGHRHYLCTRTHAGGIGNSLKAAELAPSSRPPLPIPRMQGIQFFILSLSINPKSLRSHFCLAI